MNDDLNREGSRPPSRALDAAVALVESRRGAARLVIQHRGNIVVGYSRGYAPDSLFWSFSVSKPYIAMLVHLLAERGLIELDAPVASYWPEFAAKHKETVTVRHVLQHRSGFATARGIARDALSMTSWHRSIHHIEQARLRWPVGTVAAYEVIAFGFVLGEIVQRVTGTPVRDVLKTEILDPIGALDTQLGVAPSDLHRSVSLLGANPAYRAAAALLNRRAVRTAVIPSAGISTTGRDIATFYSTLLRGGIAENGRRIFAEETITAATTLSEPQVKDKFAHAHIAWANGFQLGGATTNPLPPLGRTADSRTFGHNGSNVCVAWADPRRDLVLVYLTNYISPDSQKHITDVSDAVIAAFDPHPL